MNHQFLETHNFKAVASATTGDRVAMGSVDRATFIVTLPTGGAVLTLRQHTAATGGTSKDLSLDNPYFYKVTPATVFTKVDPSAFAAAYDVSVPFTGAAGVLVLEVLNDQLDSNNGFAFVSLDSSVAAPQIVVVSDARQGSAYKNAI